MVSARTSRKLTLSAKGRSAVREINQHLGIRPNSLEAHIANIQSRIKTLESERDLARDNDDAEKFFSLSFRISAYERELAFSRRLVALS
jgi:hypothetical protein